MAKLMYEVMRYWDDDHPEWEAEEHAFAEARAIAEARGPWFADVPSFPLVRAGSRG